jgi:FtsZ-interacting cell division protein ZipA
MDPIVIGLIVLVVLVLVGVWMWIAGRRRSERLQERFGPEYDRMVETSGDRRRAESELAAREKRRAALDIRPVDPETRDEFARQWRDTQARFVDEPGAAVQDADRLVAEVMRTRGYPVEDFTQREADISVDHPGVAENYRAAHGISLAHRQGQASTEDLRQAMVHYRALLEELLDAGDAGPDAGHIRVVDLRDQEVRRAQGA